MIARLPNSVTLSPLSRVERPVVQMAGLSGLIGKFLGVESAPVRFEATGETWSVTAASLVDMAAQTARGMNPDASDGLQLSNTGHPASDTITLARALKSHVDALGLRWDETSGKNNGQHAPFSWRSAWPGSCGGICFPRPGRDRQLHSSRDRPRVGVPLSPWRRNVVG